MSRALHCIAPRAGTPARRAPFPLSVRRHRGQALVLCLVLLFAGCLGLFFMFSTGRIAASRQRLDNAADAAAYSAALWRARVMNFHAYSNRAIVAEEVAIAQAVTLVSWARYFETFAANASVLATPFPPVATVLAAAADLARGNALVVEEAASEEIAATPGLGANWRLDFWRRAAELHLLADSPDAERFASAWVVDAQGDPEAMRCRMRVALKRGLVAEAADDAAVAVQQAVDPGEMLATVIADWREALPRLAPDELAKAQGVLQQFEALPRDGFVPAGGRR